MFLLHLPWVPFHHYLPLVFAFTVFRNTKKYLFNHVKYDRCLFFLEGC
jgi:hypothetical protein